MRNIFLLTSIAATTLTSMLPTQALAENAPKQGYL